MGPFLPIWVVNLIEMNKWTNIESLIVPIFIDKTDTGEYGLYFQSRKFPVTESQNWTDLFTLPQASLDQGRRPLQRLSLIPQGQNE